jgi:hypothetical protein
LTSTPIDRLALDISNAPDFTLEHLAAARAVAGLGAVSLPSTGRQPRSRAKRAVLDQAERAWLRQQVLGFQEQVLPGWELVKWVERKPPPVNVSVHSGSPEWHKIHASHPSCEMAAFMLAILAAREHWGPAGLTQL